MRAEGFTRMQSWCVCSQTLATLNDPQTADRRGNLSMRMPNMSSVSTNLTLETKCRTMSLSKFVSTWQIEG